MATLNDAAIRRYRLSADGTQVLDAELLFSNVGGGLLDVVSGPDGNIYLAATNGIYRIVAL